MCKTKYIKINEWEKIFEKYNLKNELKNGEGFKKVANLLNIEGYDVTKDAVRKAYKRLYSESLTNGKSIIPLVKLKMIISDSMKEYGKECYSKAYQNKIKIYDCEGKVLKTIEFNGE